MSVGAREAEIVIAGSARVDLLGVLLADIAGDVFVTLGVGVLLQLVVVTVGAQEVRLGRSLNLLNHKKTEHIS